MAHIQKVSYRSKRTGRTTHRWQARFRAPDGRERTKRFDRKIDAEVWLAGNGADIARGSWVDPDSGRIPLATYANRWLEGRAQLRASIAAKYRGLLDRHILPSLGATAIANITPSSVRSWHASLHRRHPSTAAGAYRLLSTILKTAVDDDLIPRSPCRVKGASAEHAEERPTASPEEVTAAADAVPIAYRLTVLLAAWCQLRRSEVLALQRRDVDLNAGVLEIQRAWVHLEGGGSSMGPPKTEAGRRTVAIPANIQPDLAAHLSLIGTEPTSWLFPGEANQPISPRTLDRAWKTARAAIHRPDLRFHDLRHSGLTWSAATGASVAEIMKRGGHSSPVAALRYQHATMDREMDLAARLATLAPRPSVFPTDPSEIPADEVRTKLPFEVEVKAVITPLTSDDDEQSQRGSNPCLHLERAVRVVQGVRLSR